MSLLCLMFRWSNVAAVINKEKRSTSLGVGASTNRGSATWTQSFGLATILSATLPTDSPSSCGSNCKTLTGRMSLLNIRLSGIIPLLFSCVVFSNMVCIQYICLLFRVEDEDSDYRLWVGDYFGNATDSFSVHTGYAFSTVDRNNDEAPPGFPCAPAYGGGWWFYRWVARSKNIFLGWWWWPIMNVGIRTFKNPHFHRISGMCIV